ncbi:MAG: HAD hydrolase family protein [Saprospiraceae bacterium]|nr:HAD hydrolase family protein [Saprospiraceae bacterium]
MSGETTNNSYQNLFDRFNSVNSFVFDVDGVFTNGDVLVMENGEMLRVMSTRDGQAVRYAIEAGYHVAVITKGASEGVRLRFEYLGVPDIYDKLKEKTEAFTHFQNKYNLDRKEILFMGDDIPDLPLFKLAGIAACPSDAVNDVIAQAEYVSPFKGGAGCVRDIIEKIMRLQGKWPV